MMDGTQDDWTAGVDGDIPTIDLDALKAETERLNGLSDTEYELARVRVAKAFKVRPGYFDAQRKKARSKADDDDDAKGKTPVEDIEPWHQPVNGAALADEIRDRLRAHVVFERATDADALAVWVLGAYAMDVWGLFPKVMITAPERACGKSTLANVLATVAPRALSASNATAAAIFRGIELWAPTLVLDEVDTWLDEKPELRGVINSGHDRDGAHILRCVGDDHEPRQFSTWCPMIISGIGKPADTIVSRSIVVSLRRRLPHEKVTRRPADLKNQMIRVRRQAMRWVDDNRIRLGTLDIEPPECGDDRRLDNFVPLYRVAAVLGGEWPHRIEAAYLAGADSDEAEESAGVMLLRDLMEMIERQGNPSALSSDDIVCTLASDDSKPWIEWRRGKPANARTFAKALRPYGVRSRDIKMTDGSVRKGYRVADIRDAFVRYASQSANPLPNCNQKENSNSNPLPDGAGSGSRAEKLKQNQSGSGVADRKALQGGVPDPNALDPEMWR